MEEIAADAKAEFDTALLARALLANTDLGSFLKGTNFELKYLDTTGKATDTPGDDSAIGFSYAAKTGLAQMSASERVEYRLDFASRGTVSFDPDVKPVDYLETGLEFMLYRFDNGLSATVDEKLAARVLQQVSMEAAARNIAAGSPEWEALVRSNPELVVLNRNLTYVGVGGAVRLETDQEFDERQWVYGVEAFSHYAVRDPSSFAAKFNVFDFPFKIIRTLWGHPLGWQTYQYSVPRVRLALEQVDPNHNEARASVLGNRSRFERIQIEVGLSSPIAQVGDDAIVVNLSYRYFKELGPPSEVEALGLDSFRYLTAVVELPQNISLTYSRGELPFDLQSETTFALGYRFVF